MAATITPQPESGSGVTAQPDSPKGRKPRGCRRTGFWGCGCLAFVLVGIVLLVILCLNRVPKSYPPVANPIEPPSANRSPGGGLDGFESPYLGHTGSWDGKGGGMGGSSKVKELNREREMGLRWTFMPVYWRALEPDGPVNPEKEIPPSWRELDAFVIAAHERKLNVLMQAPVMGGNAGGPPRWAGRREKGKSAPSNMDAAAAFAGKLAARYCPGGVLSRQQGWQETYGVRAWEMDNEPNGYLTHWKDQAADYAEFVTKVAAAIRQADAEAIIIGPGANIGPKSLNWIESALDASALNGSPEYRRQARPYSIGPALDVVSFHIYEGLDTAFAGEDRTIEIAFSEIRNVFEHWENRAPGFTYPRKQEYWHTEGNFDFIGVLSAHRRAAWRIQFLTRAFAAGIRKVMVMDASGPEQAAVRAYIGALANPFPMDRADGRVRTLRGAAVAFFHADSPEGQARRVWILWSVAGAGDAEVEIPVTGARIKSIQLDGSESSIERTNDRVRIVLRGESKIAPPVLLIDGPEG